MKKQQRIQEEEYLFPYHYIPQAKNGLFLQNVYWSWGFHYLGGLHIAKKFCGAEPYENLLDIGCGDGRFICELAKDNPASQLMGVDYSERAIRLAKALNPELNYHTADIMTDNLAGRKFDVVTMIEVIEHIPPDTLPDFLKHAVNFLKPGGRLILTVPHRNKTLQAKHFQHFDSALLNDLLSPLLSDLSFYPFDFTSKILNVWFRIIGRTGKYFIITWTPLLKAFYKYYINNHLYGNDEASCSRIACIGRKRLV